MCVRVCVHACMLACNACCACVFVMHESVLFWCMHVCLFVCAYLFTSLYFGFPFRPCLCACLYGCMCMRAVCTSLLPSDLSILTMIILLIVCACVFAHVCLACVLFCLFDACMACYGLLCCTLRMSVCVHVCWRTGLCECICYLCI